MSRIRFIYVVLFHRHENAMMAFSEHFHMVVQNHGTYHDFLLFFRKLKNWDIGMTAVSDGHRRRTHREAGFKPPRKFDLFF